MIQKLIPRLLNMESDETLVKPNEFIDAVNVKVDGRDGTDFGVIKHAEGNTIVEFYDAAQTETSEKEVVTGFCEDEAFDTVYIFCAGTTKDSIYMVSNTDQGYKMVLLARSSSFDLDGDKFTAANIIRVFDKQIDSSAEDTGGGVFNDGGVITDFDPNTVIEQDEGIGEEGFAELAITITNVNEEAEVDFGVVSPQLSGHTFLVRNTGTNPGSVSFSYEVSSVSSLTATVGFDSGGSDDTSPTNISQSYTIGPGDTRVVRLFSEILGTPVDGDSFSSSISVTSDAPGFNPFFADWNTVLNEIPGVLGTLSYSPAGLDGNSFTTVPENTATTSSKFFQISNFSSTEPDTITANLEGKVYIDSYDITGQLDDLTYLKTSWVETALDDNGNPNDGSLLIFTADDSSSALNFSLPPGSRVQFELVFQTSDTTTSLNGNVRLKVEYSADSVFGLIPSPATYTGPDMGVEVKKEEEDAGPTVPLVSSFNTLGFDSTYFIDPYVNGNPYFPPSLFQGIQYTVSETAGVSATIEVETSVTTDPNGIGSLVRELIFCNAVGFDQQEGGVTQALGSYQTIQPSFQFILDDSANPSSANSVDIKFEIRHNSFTESIISEIQGILNGTIGFAGFEIQATVLETNNQLWKTNISVALAAIENVQSIEIKVWDGPATSLLSETSPNDSLSSGENIVYEAVVSNISSNEDTWPDSAERAQAVIQVKNNGSVPFSAGDIDVKMFHTRCNFSAGGGYVGSEDNYTSNSNVNQEYLNSNEFWCGYGGVGRSETLEQWPDNGGLPPFHPSLFSSYIVAFPGRGISDAAPQGGWQPMYPSVSQLPVLGTAHEGWGGANALFNGDPTQPFWDANNYFLGVDAFDNGTFVQPEPVLANSFLGELDDEDDFKFKFAVPLNQWSGYTGSISVSQRSPVVFVEEGNFNTVAGNAISEFVGTLSPTVQVSPGNSIYFVFNCNVPGISDAIFRSMVYITPPAGSVQADNRYSVLLRGDSSVTQSPGSSPPPTDSSERGYSEVEGGDENQTGGVVPERVIQNKPIKVSPFSSTKALKRANIKLEDKDGIRY